MGYFIKPRFGSQTIVFAGLLTVITVFTVTAQTPKSVWYVKAGANGDGISADSPFGSTANLEAATKPGDIIMVLPGDTPLDGGLTLKEGQVVIGLQEGDRKPVITNTDSTKNGGVGIVLAQNNRIWNVRIENTWASGMLGTNVSGALIEEAEVIGANQSGSFTDVGEEVFGFMPHGGIVFIGTGLDGSGINYVMKSEVRDARGFGIASFALDGVKGGLSISSSKVEGGSPVARFDYGIFAVAGGASSEMLFELTDCQVSGRLSRGGRNVGVVAAAEANTKARIYRSHLGEAGQDGVLAVAMSNPAQVDLEIRDCLIEKAGWTNIEGTMLNLPPLDPLRAHEARVSVEVVGSTIRGAGEVVRFEEEKPENIFLGSSATAQQMDPNSKAPFPPGTYQLTVRNTRLEGEGGYDVVIGNPDDRFDLPPEQSKFEVLLRENTFSEKGEAEFLISAPNVSIDARKNCWGTTDGLPEDRILLKKTAKLSQLDASEPSSCAEVESN